MVHDGNDKMNKVEIEMPGKEAPGPGAVEVSGTFGGREAVSWYLTGDGSLVISGFGKVPDFSCGRNPAPPWEDKKDLIRELVIREGIDEIGIRAFAGCRNLKKAILPETLFRIDAYAFMDCTLLEEVQIPEGVRFCHVYETVDDSDDTELLRFGSQAFYRTPWALARWGKFYIQKGVLYALFTDEEYPELPSTVHAISKFAFAGTNAQTVYMPDSVTSISDFAFSSSHLQSLIIPDSVSADHIGSHAFTATELSRVSFPGSWRKVRRRLIDQLLRRGSRGEPDDLISLPSIYEIVLTADKKYGPFKKLRIRERQPAAAGKSADGTSACVYGVRLLSPGVPLQRKILRGSVLIGIVYDDNLVQYTATCSWNRYEEWPEDFRLYPCVDPDSGAISAWSDHENGVDDNSIKGYYISVDGTSDEGNTVRTGCKDCREEWFWSNGEGFYSNHYYGGGLEIDLLELWIRQHPEVRIRTTRECSELCRAGDIDYMPPDPNVWFSAYAKPACT